MKKVTRLMAGAVCAAAALMGSAPAAETVLFSDDFETDSSALWNVVEDSASGTPDSTVDWAFDYSTTEYTLNGATETIPPSPNSDGSSRGVKLTVNNGDATAETAAVNLYARDQNFSGNYALRFDMWINYNGGPYGGTGSTEFGIFGLNHLGTEPNWAAPAGVLTTSDGIWYAVSGEAGAANDYRNYEGDPLGSPLPFNGIDGGFLDRDEDGAAEQEPNSAAADDYPLNLLFPSPPFETVGVPGKRWVQVELRQENGIITWLMDGYVIAEKPNITLFSEGTIMLGMMDIFSSIANPADQNFVLFDNVRVVSLDPAESKPRLTLMGWVLDAAEPGTSGSMAITRTGDLSEDLDVTLRVRGTARNGVDYETIPTTVTIPAGISDLPIEVNVINDQSGEPIETVEVDLVANMESYEVFAPMTATVNIFDDGDVAQVGMQVLHDQAFEGVELEDGLFSVYRVGDANSDLFVNLTISGSAAGEDYELSQNPVVIPFGSTSTRVNLRALADASEDGNETVEIAIAEGEGYSVIATNASGTITIREAGPIVFEDDFGTDSSGDYTIQFSAANEIEDYRAAFSFDYSQAETFVPPSPRGDGSSTGLLLTVNKNDEAGSAAAVNAYTDESFSGNYLVKFDMFLNYDSSAPGTTEAAIFGINHSGLLANRYNTAGSDGVWFFVETDASSQGGRAYVMFQPVDTNAVPPFESRRADEPYFQSFFTVPPHLAAGGPAGAWVDVSILQEDDVITWRINGLPIFQRSNTTDMDAGKLMLGFADTFNSVGSTNNFVIYDNVRVYQLAEGDPEPTEITITGITRSDDSVVITASTTGELDGLQLVGADDVAGPYTEVTNAEIEVVNENTAQATVPITSDHRFFQVRQP